MLGTLPQEAHEISGVLHFVSLSHNRFDGTLSQAVQSKYFDKFDCSYNKLTGELNQLPVVGIANISLSSRTFKAEMNRLSGSVPEANWSSISSLSVLYGNLIGCKAAAELPENDANFNGYSCGSDEYDVSLIAFGAVVLLDVIVMFFVFLLFLHDHAGEGCFRKIRNKINALLLYADTDMYTDILEKSPNAILFLCEVRRASNVLVALALSTAVSCVTLYLSLKVNDGSLQFRTHSNQYSWLVSGAYVSGLGPSLGLFLIFASTASSLLLFSLRSSESIGVKQDQDPKIPTDTTFTLTSLLSLYATVLATVVCCLGMVLAAYIGYIQGRLYLEPSSYLYLEFMITLFSAIWRVSIRSVVRYALQSHLFSETAFTQLETFILCISSIIIPVMAVATTDPNCFRGLFLGAEDIAVSYVSYACLVYSLRGCLITGVITKSATYPSLFIYNNQCYSSVITYYSPPLVYGSILNVFLILFWALIAQCDFNRVPLLGLFRCAFPSVLWGADCVKIIPASTIAANLISTMLVIMTFGATSPGVIAAETVNFLTLAFFWRVAIGRIVQEIFLPQNANQLVAEKAFVIKKLLEDSCRGLSGFLTKSSCIMVIVAGLFYALLLADMALDRKSVSVAVALSILSLCVPIIYSIVFVKKVLIHRPALEVLVAGHQSSDIGVLRHSSITMIDRSRELFVDSKLTDEDAIINTLHKAPVEELMRHQYYLE